MRKFIVLLLLCLFVSCSQNTYEENEGPSKSSKEKEKPVVQVQVNNKKNNDMDIITQSNVLEHYKALVLKITNKNNNKTFNIEIPFKKRTKIENTSLEIELLEYYPDFIMDEGKGIITKSLEERNPAARVNIYKDGELAFKGWLFGNFPNVHAFEDSNYDVELVSSVKVKNK
ncbi:MAG: DUF2155 domain-containing protein [Deferribacterota bacterium]|nr:DUF2155 domain-containing protein [Deferribacterota bacterium]